MKTPPLKLAIEATPEHVEAAKARLISVAARVYGGSFATTEPRWAAAIDALPDLHPLLATAVEFRSLVLDALVDAGAIIPRETWDALQIGGLYREAQR